MLKTLNRTTAGVTSQRPIKVMQFGEGNFLRAFVDWMIDILNEKTDFNGDVQIVQPLLQGMGDMLNNQQGLYHVLLQGIQNGKAVDELRLIKSVRGVINPYRETEAFLKAAENPDLKFIVSNTTEAGIEFLPSDTSPEQLPASFPGKVTVLLYHRYKFFNGDAHKGLVLLPCELIEKNGIQLRECILQYIKHWNLPGSFREWITNANVFCNTLVDRIVPGFPKDTIGEIKNQTGFDDNLVVKAEPFHLWVIEGPESLRSLLPFDRAGLQVVFSNDLTPYRSRKVRILNGAHTAMVPVAYLQGLRTVREAVDDVTVGKFVRETIEQEIIPTLDLPEAELRKFSADVIERFQNPFIRHELLSIALNSVSKFGVRVVPSLRVYFKRKGELPERLIQSLGALIVFYRGEWNGELIPLNDGEATLSLFRNAWKSGSIEEVVSMVLRHEKELFKDQLSDLPGIHDALIDAVKYWMKTEATATRTLL